MAQERNFTGEDRKWLMENYSHLSNTACINALKCGYKSLQKLVAECGLEYHTKKKPKTHFIAKKDRTFLWMDKDARERCMDCKSYVRGGICSNGGKVVGALWQKRCFE